jgi:hypothetical protein
VLDSARASAGSSVAVASVANRSATQFGMRPRIATAGPRGKTGENSPGPGATRCGSRRSVYGGL